MAISKSEARKLAKDGLEVGAKVLRGVFTLGPTGPQIDQTQLSEWLAQHEGLELILVAASVDNLPADKEIKSCYTCGRDYQGAACRHCTSARARLRG